jgi:hypothetical protein
MPGSWPKYRLGTIEDLDTTVENYGVPVPTEEVQVQVVPYREPYLLGDGTHWHGTPHRISGLARGKYDAYTRWVRSNGAKVIDHVGDDDLPSFELT